MNQPTDTNKHVKLPKRGRPSITESKKEDMRQKIASVTLNLFRTEGYRQISMRRIAREIGCSPMTLYKYYDAKVDILHTLWSNIFETVFAKLNGLDLKDNSPREQLTVLASTYVNYWLNNSEHYRLVFMTEGVSQPEVNVFVANPDIAAHYEIFTVAILNTSSKQLEQEELKQKLDTMVCFLNGIAHNLITISEHQWPSSEYLIDAAIHGVIDN